jgi:hypothetical protein
MQSPQEEEEPAEPKAAPAKAAAKAKPAAAKAKTPAPAKKVISSPEHVPPCFIQFFQSFQPVKQKFFLNMA